MRAAKLVVVAGFSALALGGMVRFADWMLRDHRARLDAETSVADLKKRVAALQAVRCEPEPRGPEAQGARFALDEELALFRQADRLGLVEEVARSARTLTSRQQQRLAVAIVREARANNLDPRLVAALIHVESNFDSYAVSSTGALGLMQMLPSTGRAVSRERDEQLADARALFDYERNVTLGCTYLANLVRQFGRLDHALLAYNVGPNAARKLLAEGAAGQEALQGYAHKVLGEFARLADAGPLRTASRVVPSGAEAAQ